MCRVRRLAHRLIWLVTHDTVPMNVESPRRASSATISRKRPLGLIVLLALLVIAGLGLAGYVASGPYRTLNGLQAAITQGDATAVARYVDFPTLRQNLKDQLNASASSRINDTLPNGIVSRIAGGIANSVVDATVDSLVTPVGLNRLLMGAALIANNLTDNSGISLEQRLEKGRRSFESLNTFTLAFSSAVGSELVIVLTRNGLDWQLTNVRIPVGATAPTLNLPN